MFFIILSIILDASAYDVRVGSVSLNYSDISIIVEVNNYDRQAYFDMVVKFDGAEIYSVSEKYIEAKKTINFKIPFSEAAKNLLYDCMSHNVTVNVNVLNSQDKNSLSKSLSLEGENFMVEIRQEEKSLKGPVSIKVKDYSGKNNVSDALVIVKGVNDNVNVRLSTDSLGIAFFNPLNYGVGEYEVEVKKREKFFGKYYCDTKKYFEIRKMLKFRSIHPENPVIGEEVMVELNCDEYGDIYLEKENRDTGEKDYVIIGKGIKFFPVNFTVPGNYSLHLYKNKDFWNDTIELFVMDQPYLKVSIEGSPKEIKTGDEIEIKITGADYNEVTATITNPDGSISIYSKDKFKYTLSQPGDYEIYAKSKGMHTGHLSFTALKIMNLILPESLKFNDLINLKVLDENNKSVNAVIKIDGKTLTSGSDFRIEKTFYSIAVQKEGYMTIEKNINAFGTIKIICPDLIEYGENEKIYVEANPKADDINIKILKDDGSENIEVVGYEYEFKPNAGEYTITADKEQYISDTKKLTVKPAEVLMNATLNYGKLIINLTSKNNPVKDAEIIIKTPKGETISLKTDSNGTVIFTPQEDGAYIIKSEKKNYISTEKIVNVPKFPLFEIIIALGLILLMLISIGIFRYERKTEKKKEEEKKMKEEEKEKKPEFSSPLQ